MCHMTPWRRHYGIARSDYTTICHTDADLFVDIMVVGGAGLEHCACILFLSLHLRRIYFLASQERRFEVLFFWRWRTIYLAG